MEKIWNDFELKKPPFVTLPSKHSQFVLKLHGAIDTYFSKITKHEEEFNETAALLSRLMARRKNSFKKMKGFKDVCKLNAALCRLLKLDFKRDLDTFRSTLPDVAYEEGTSVHLPTRDSYDYLLLRLIALYELHHRIEDCCLAAAEYFTCQLRLCYFFEINTLLLAVLAKIHSLNIKLANIAIDFYNNSLAYSDKLPVNPKSTFLKNEQLKLPEKLDSFNIVALDRNQMSVAKEHSLNDLVEQERDLANIKAHKWKKTDVGTEIKRSSIKPRAHLFNIESLNSAEAIKQFIASETKSRASDLSNTITKQILSHEWAGATKLFERKVKNGEVKKAVNIFRKFLSLKIV